MRPSRPVTGNDPTDAMPCRRRLKSFRTRHFHWPRLDAARSSCSRAHDSVNELVQGGVPLGGQVSPETLEAVFRNVSPVHDGATIVEGDRITRVGAVNPKPGT